MNGFPEVSARGGLAGSVNPLLPRSNEGDGFGRLQFFQGRAPVLLPFEVSQLALHFGKTCKPRLIDSGTGHGAARFTLMAAVSEPAILRESDNVVERDLDACGVCP